MALTVVFSSRIMMPITLLNKLISTIEEENDTFIQVKSNDELGQIGNRFNQMKRKLQEMSANMYLSRVQEKEAQLSALQSQINPHFLYNTLDNIYCIAPVSYTHLNSLVYTAGKGPLDVPQLVPPGLLIIAGVDASVAASVHLCGGLNGINLLS